MPKRRGEKPLGLRNASPRTARPIPLLSNTLPTAVGCASPSGGPSTVARWDFVSTSPSSRKLSKPLRMPVGARASF